MGLLWRSNSFERIERDDMGLVYALLCPRVHNLNNTAFVTTEAMHSYKAHPERT